jgi:methyl-galactoside transport system permease protein
VAEKTATKKSKIGTQIDVFKGLSKKDKQRYVTDILFNNAMYIVIILAIIFIAIRVPTFVSLSSIVNIISLTAAKLPIALGVAGCIVLAGTDISAGRAVGLAACISGSLLTTANKVFPGMGVQPLPLVILIVLAVGAIIGLVNGFCMAKFKLHPYIVTLSTQLILYGTILLYLKMGENNGQTLSSFSEGYRNLVAGTLFTIGGVSIPRYVLYAVILTAIMWIVWNKTTLGKNMFAVGSNEEAANVSGVNVMRTIILVFVLAGMMYAITGFIEGARIASINGNTGFNYEADAIAACVIGGVSFVGGIGKISGIVVGVLLLQVIFTGLNFLSVDQNILYIIKGLVILVACAIDMRKYLVRK